MKSIEKKSLECEQNQTPVCDEDRSAIIQYSGMFSSIVTDSYYVLDILQGEICYVKSDNLFLCGFSTDDVLKEGIGFYARIVYPDDLPLWTNMRNAISQYFEKFKEKWDEIDYFSCTFRLQRTCLISPSRPLIQMVYHRMKHIQTSNRLRYFICSVSSSTIKETGNLCMYNKDGLTYEDYNFTTKRWNVKKKPLLTKREKAILMLAHQGKNSIEIACCLCKGRDTIRNQIKTLLLKLNVHSIRDAIELANYNGLMYPKQDADSGLLNL